jgi:ferric-dicitrate binding protein FerR (iron transport regulator)
MSHPIYFQYSGLQDFEKMNPEEQIMFRASSFRLTEGESPEKALASLKQRLYGKQTGRPVSGQLSAKNLWTVSSIAAAILILTGLWQIILFSGTTRISSERGSHVSYILSDGSEIRLNSDSKISFSNKKFVASRQLSLNGEAFFEVKKAGPFTVKSPNGTVTVLGTSFNVFSRDNEFKVACLTGEVRVTSLNQSVTIGPGRVLCLKVINLTSIRTIK